MSLYIYDLFYLGTLIFHRTELLKSIYNKLIRLLQYAKYSNNFLYNSL